jgi:replicative DNA helicase
VTGMPPLVQPRDLGRGEPRTALSALVALHQAEAGDHLEAAQPTGFSPLDDVLSGGPRPGEVLLVGGKPGVGKTIACLQWARSMARRGVVAVYLCFDHDPAALVARLLACELREAALATGRLVDPDPAFEELQGRLRDVAAGALTLGEALDSDPLLRRAEQRMAAYGDRLVLFPGSATSTDVAALGDAVGDYAGEPCVVFVDYVQKLPVAPAVATEGERVRRAIGGLKELALEQHVPVVAVSAADERGLTARRLHLHHFRGAPALAYEADAVVVLNDKAAIAAKARVTSPAHHDDRRRVVFTVEKNRHGTTGIDLEFVKQFDSYRFDPQGAAVSDRLWVEG